MTAPRRFYNRDAFKQLQDEELATLSPSECIQASEQLDQDLVVVLQEIDAHFVRARRAITDRILPAVEAHGESSHSIWQNVKFWKSFAELAAGVRLTEVPARDEDTSTASAEPLATPAGKSAPAPADDDVDVTVRFDNTAASAASDFDRIQEGVRRELGSATAGPSASAPTAPPKNARYLEDDFDVDADVPLPDLQTISLGDMPGTYRPSDGPSTAEKGKARAQPERRRSRASVPRTAPVVAATSTPAATRRTAPPEALAGWDGLADLAKTPLSAFQPTSRIVVPPSRQLPPRSLLDDSLSQLDPPSLLQMMSIKRPVAPSRTPAKEAAERMTADVLRSGGEAQTTPGKRKRSSLTAPFDPLEDSPMMSPPSVLKNWGAGCMPPPH